MRGFALVGAAILLVFAGSPARAQSELNFPSLDSEYLSFESDYQSLDSKEEWQHRLSAPSAPEFQELRLWEDLTLTNDPDDEEVNFDGGVDYVYEGPVNTLTIGPLVGGRWDGGEVIDYTVGLAIYGDHWLGDLFTVGFDADLVYETFDDDSDSDGVWASAGATMSYTPTSSAEIFSRLGYSLVQANDALESYSLVEATTAYYQEFGDTFSSEIGFGVAYTAYDGQDPYYLESEEYIEIFGGFTISGSDLGFLGLDPYVEYNFEHLESSFSEYSYTDHELSVGVSMSF